MTMGERYRINLTRAKRHQQHEGNTMKHFLIDLITFIALAAMIYWFLVIGWSIS